MKLRKVKLFKQLLRKDSIARGHPIYVLDPDFTKIINVHAEILLERYKRLNPNKHWTEKQEKNMQMGMAGQKAFELMLQYIGTPYIINDPLVPYKHQKPYDCFIPTVGTIEIKTEPSGERIRNCIVKAREWHHNDYLITWQASDKQLAFIGWLTGKEVEKIGITGKGESDQTQYASAYVIPLIKLRSPKTFLEMLPRNQDGCSDTS